jgi:hypothetical protein
MICAMIWPTNTWRQSALFGLRGSRARSSPTGKAAFSSIRRRYITPISTGLGSGRGGRSTRAPKINAHLEEGGKTIIHHNHVGFHSLSGGDWLGMIDKPAIMENWVHCWDGSWFRGQVVWRFENELRAYCTPGMNEISDHHRKAIAIAATLSSSGRLANRECDDLLDATSHIVNKEMMSRGWVTYVWFFGSCLGPLTSAFG